MRKVCVFLTGLLILLVSVPANAIVKISTVYGNGADASASEDSGGDLGSATGNYMDVSYNGTSLHTMSYVRFDLDQIEPGTITEAEFHIYWYRDNPDNITGVIWGLNPGYAGEGTHQGAHWAEDETFRWSTAPETVTDGSPVRAETFSNSVLLGTCPGGGAGPTIGSDVTAIGNTFRPAEAANLVAFLNNCIAAPDPNGATLATLIIERDSPTGSVMQYATKDANSLDLGQFPAPVGTYAPYLKLRAQVKGQIAPSPIDGAADVNAKTVLLGWNDPDSPDSYDVYFGPAPTALSLVSQQAGTTYDPGAIEWTTTYYWRVDKVYGGVPETGDVWAFTTVTPECTDKTGDVNGDCVVDLADVALMAENWAYCGWTPVDRCP